MKAKKIAKVALITGAARRVGAEIARYLHANGMNVILHYHTSQKEALQLCDALNELRPYSAQVACTNLSEIDFEVSLLEQTLAPWERLDVLINNASRFYRTPFGQVTEYTWSDLIHSNLKAPFFLSQAAAPHLRKHQGSIINITDIHAERPLRDYSAYCIAKSGLAMMTKVLAKELGPHIRVNGVAPGCVLWPEGNNQLSEVEKQKIMQQTALRKSGSPAEIAKTVWFLIEEATYTTGEIINVDGGRLLYS